MRNITYDFNGNIQTLQRNGGTDHLGNTRVIFTDSNDDGTPEIIQEADYYPFGMRHVNSTATNHYLYNGKELNEDLGLDWYDYGARWLDVETGRWSTIDPLAEKFDSWSGYHYVVNNPINYIDPNGMDTLYINRYVDDYKYTDDFTIAYKIDFSLMKNGTETKVNLMGCSENLYLVTSKTHESIGDNSATLNDEYKLTYQKMAKRPNRKNTILVTTFGVFIHEGRDYGWSRGCKVLVDLGTGDIPLKEIEVINPDDSSKKTKKSYLQVPLQNSKDALTELRGVYDKHKKNLTGDKFILRNIRRQETKPLNDTRGRMYPSPLEN